MLIFPSMSLIELTNKNVCRGTQWNDRIECVSRFRLKSRISDAIFVNKTLCVVYRWYRLEELGPVQWRFSIAFRKVNKLISLLKTQNYLKQYIKWRKKIRCVQIFKYVLREISVSILEKHGSVVILTYFSIFWQYPVTHRW